MKLTLKSTCRKQNFPHNAPTVIIETDIDDMTLHDVLWEMVRPALIAHGFNTELVEEFFKEVEP